MLFQQGINAAVSGAADTDTVTDQSGKRQGDDKENRCQIDGCLGEMVTCLSAKNRFTDAAEGCPHTAGFGGLEQYKTDQQH